MARMSKFQNELTEISKSLSETFKKEAVQMTLEEINTLQAKFGLSNAELSKIIEIEEASVSRWKNGKYELPAYYKIAICALFKYLEDNHK
jgi:DNA-binding transcriptional regulator YiaG